MTRRGQALLVALLVVLLGGALVAAAVTAAVTELAAGWTWASSGRAGQAAASGAAGLTSADLVALDSVLDGGVVTAAGVDSARRLGPGLAMAWSSGRWRDGQALVELLLRRPSDSAGWVPVRIRSQLHPVP